jgi:hypothetical protein
MLFSALKAGAVESIINKNSCRKIKDTAGESVIYFL